MPPNLSISEQITFSTIRIESVSADGSVGTGTGFFWRCLEREQSYVPVIATNKHVVAGAVQGRFHLTHRDDEGAPLVGQHLYIALNDFEQRWIPHPDPEVDLCVMPLLPLLTEAQAQGHKFFWVSLNRELVPTEEERQELGVLEEIVMVGYPNGIWDQANNMPIVRRGVTATSPRLNYEGRREFLIDAACFPGSSGSPIFLYNNGSWADQDGGIVVGGVRVKLLGVLYAGPQHTATGEIQIVTVPTQQRAIAISSIPNNLGLVISSSRLLELDEVVQQRVSASAK